MKKRRLLGIIMMIGATGIAVYEGLWNLFMQSVIKLIQTYYDWKFEEVALELLKIFIFFPMVMFFAYALWKIGQMIFLDD